MSDLKNKKVISVLKKIFSPHWTVLIVLNVVSCILLCCVFIKGYSESITAYLSYAMSAYALVCDAVNIVPAINAVERFKDNNRLVKKYFSDKSFQFNLSMYRSLITNLAFSFLNFLQSNLNSSVWYASLGIYYLALGIMKIFLLRSAGRAESKPRRERMVYELKIFRAAGVVMFVLNGIMAAMTAQMILNDDYSGKSQIMTIANAAFTFTFMIIAVVNLKKYRKTDQPVYSASKMINFACALMSILSLQNSMVSVFGEDDSFRFVMNIATGTVVFILVFGLAVYMICRANKKLKEVNYVK